MLKSGHPLVVLRPTLMFGWFDRKHLGWLGRFMKRTPLFPCPAVDATCASPLYVGDFCDIIISCLARGLTGAAFNISGQEKIDYIDLVRLVREATGATAPIIKVPYRLFQALLAGYGLFDRSPPFTTRAACRPGDPGNLRSDRLAAHIRGAVDTLEGGDDGDFPRSHVRLDSSRVLNR